MRSPQPPEDDGSVLCRDLDPLHPLRSELTRLGFQQGEYSGIPVPIEGNTLVVHPSYSFAGAFNEINDLTTQRDRADSPRPEHADWKVRNIFYSGKLRSDIAVLERPDGRVVFRVRPAANSMGETLATLHASDAWGVDQEQAALKTLAGMIRHRQFKQYLLTGMFLETSVRSHVPYIFRRLRPTIALAAIPPQKKHSSEEATILCALCMHPIAYYAGSWAGAMCPTDDVIAHLSLMRGDEHMFWKRSNQHPAWRSQAGVGL